MIETLLNNVHLGRPDLVWVFVPVLVVFVLSVLRRRRPWTISLIRALTLGVLALALCDPVRQEKSSKREIAAVFDVSYSVSKNAQEALANALMPYLDKDTSVTLYPFARQVSSSPVIVKEGERDLYSAIQRAAEGMDTGETNLAAAINTAVARSESSSVLLLTDGNETLGNSGDTVRGVAQRGVRLFPLIPDDAVFRGEGITISSLHAPVTVGAGDSVEVRATVKNSAAVTAPARLELWIDNEKLFSQSISVAANAERVVTIKSPPVKGGLHRLRAVVGQEGAAKPEERHRWLSVKEKSKLLLLSGTRDDQRYLKQLIAIKGYALQDIVADGNVEIPATFDGFSSVILNNVSINQLPKGFLTTLKGFVQGGGGLLMVGGDRSFGLGNYIDTPLEEISPLKFVPPQTEKRRLTNAVALVIDKSGSMAEEDKIESARQAALLSISALRDNDFLGVIGFDSNPFVIIDVKPVEEIRYEAERRLRNLTAAGKTNLLPALATARQKLDRTGASRKHIIVLSDGKFPLTSDAYVSEINELKRAGISVSAVALGIDADVPFMKMLSKYGRGAFYHTLDASQLPKIFVEDIKVSTGEKTLSENQDFPVGVGPGGLKSSSVEGFPPLRGFVETLPKRGSELELITKKDERIFPVLGSWRFGNGKVIAFTSDANGRWSAPWSQWNGFSTFWTQLIESIKDESGAKSGDVDFDLRYSVNRKALVFDLAIFDEKLRTEQPPRIIAEVQEPGGEVRQLSFRATKRGRFEARIENSRPGDYKLNVNYGALKLPPLAVTIGGELFGEVPGRGVNVQVLEELAFATGGSINPAPKQVLGFERVSEHRERLFVPLLFLAFILILVEAFLREGAVGSLFRRRRSSIGISLPPTTESPLRRAA